MANEVELGTGIPTVIQGYTVAVLLDAVRIWWDDQSLKKLLVLGWQVRISLLLLLLRIRAMGRPDHVAQGSIAMCALKTC